MDFRLRVVRSERDRAQEGLAEQERKTAASAATHKSLESRLTELQSSIDAVPVADTASIEQDDIQIRLGEHAKASRDVAAGEASLQHFRNSLAVKESALATAAAAAENRRVAKHWIAALQGSSGVLHRDRLPSLVHRQALRELESGVNGMLGKFEDPFFVRADDELSYTATFGNGTVMPAKGLSGGQQVMLAICMRWELNSLFAGQIGMMTLDEPTAGFDSRHIELLEEVLLGLAEVALAKNFQVIIITHNMRLERAFNQVIRLKKAIE